MSNKRIVKTIARAMTVTIGVVAVVAPLTACNDGRSNETTPLVLASDVLDGVFNPFFYTAGADGEVVGQTQVGMLSSDESGKLIANWNEPSVAFDFGIVTTGTSNLKDNAARKDDDIYKNYYTDYYFALKNDIKFSDGEPLTYKDVLYNIYMYLDPAYTGSSTMYSVSIKGLSDYRAGIEDNSGADFESFYESIVEGRLNMIYDWATDAIQDGDDFEFSWDNWINYEYYYQIEHEPLDSYRPIIAKDIETLRDLFNDEIDSDWSMAMAADLEKDYEQYVDRNGNRLITEHWQAFLYGYNLITFDRTPGIEGVNNGKPFYTMHDNTGATDHSEAAMKKFIRDYYFAGYGSSGKNHSDFASKLVNLLSYTSTGAGTFRDYLRSDAMSYYIESNPGKRIDRVSGIEVVQMSEIPDAERDNKGDAISDTGDKGDKRTSRQLKNKNGEPGTFEVLHIRINGVDPKAIQNFGFTVAPGHYYSPIWNSINMNYGNDYANPNFGVRFNSFDFMRGIRENQLPLGAGPYKAASRTSDNTTDKGAFFDGNVVYMHANEHFMLGEPKIKKLRFQVINSNMLYEAVSTGAVNYASPSMTQRQVSALEGEDRDKLSSANADNLGYGYIGISARYVPNLWVRRAIMSTFDPDLCVDYYGGEDYATVIRRPMSKTLRDYYNINGAFDNFSNYSYYPYGQEGGNASTLGDETDPFKKRQKAADIASKYLEMGGCTEVNSNGIRIDPVSGQPLKYTFTVAGNSEDHPAYALLNNSKEILESIGLDITLTQDSTALVKLAAGRLTVWAAAWSSSSDPDMYQVYHKNSTATSTRAWGYDFLLGQHQNNTNAPERTTEYNILNDLADLIDAGRETTVLAERQGIYTEAQNKLMQLAVEFPTYQRKVYYIWQKGLFKEDTMFTGSQVTTYQSPLSRIWEVEYAD